MAKTKFLIYGGGGHFRVICSILEKNNFDIIGFFDRDNENKNINKISYLGDYDNRISPNAKIIVAIGNNIIREKITKKIEHSFGLVIDPDTRISKNVFIGDGSQIITSSTINTGVKIGKHCIINTNSSIDHDCIINDYVHIAPGVILCGGVLIGRSTLVGAGTTILPNIKVGENVVIGAGSLVNKDIPDNTKVYGTPAIVIDNEKR
tara:strand:- start:82 stop:699 length:618 start_codon:yes stop_codon:yes gene_type:complete